MEAGSDFYSADSEPHWAFRDFEVGGGLGIKGTLSSDIQVAEVKLYAGANGRVYVARPGLVTQASNWEWDRIELTGEAGAKFRVGWFVKEAKGEIKWQYPPTAKAVDARMHDVSVSDWHLVKHLPGKDYAIFHNLHGTRQAFTPLTLDQHSAATAAPTIMSTPLVSNAYTYTEPSLALNPPTDQVLLAWTHDDTSKPIGRSQEVHFSQWDGSAWGRPASITDDTLLDGSPQVAWSGNDNAVAVWQRLTETLPVSTTWSTTTANKIEIATAVSSPTIDAWSPVSLLSNNAALDMTPDLTRNPNGELLAVWRRNGAGLLGGTTENPDRVMAAFYTADWTLPSVAIDDIPGLVDLAAGYGGGAATIAYTRFLTPTGSITPTLQLFTSTWDGSTWSAPQQLTDDDLGHTNPQVVYNTHNEPLLVWQAGETLRNLTTGDEADLTLDPDLVIDEFRLLHDPADNLAAVFTGQKAGQRDLFVAFYDAAHKVWGRPYHLTDDIHSEGYPAPALDSTGRLLMAYAQTQISSEERTTTDPETGETITYTVPVEGQTDLYTLSHQFVQDLTVDNLAVSTNARRLGPP